jgi:hypothetical protein
MRMDIEDFFASVPAARVYGIFRTAGYPEAVSHTLAALCVTVVPLADAARNGPAAANRNDVPDLRAHLLGRIAWVGALHPERGRRLRERLDAIAWAGDR